MIAVIADDFTGAAEIGGIGIRHGYKVTIDTQVNKDYSCDILVIATNTRSLDIESAKKQIAKVMSEVMTLKPKLIYKKTDSLLRGKVGAELNIQLKVAGKKRGLIIPANPSLDRVVIDGTYYINDMPLMHSHYFRNAVDKEASSNVLELMGDSYRGQVVVRSFNEELPNEGIVIGNSQTDEDINAWAERIDEGTLPAGGASFFDAILKKHQPNRDLAKTPFLLGKKMLYICGSTFQPSKEMVRKAKETDNEVLFMPSNLFCYDNHKKMIDSWADSVLRGIETKDKVVVAIDELECRDVNNLSHQIKEVLGILAKRVLNSTHIDELIIEGGATAYSIVEKLGFKKFYPLQELSQGVIRMKVEGKKRLFLTLKPGSYSWPKSIWNFDESINKK